ncbi:hypothetical protein PVAND_015553 [Polypedilum vanderplanki]|uniref:Leucine rich repeat containing protein n=1 Tax=Polypedilum vanderplanki TaxID=319348 RepID=A0A9J6BDB9_POLVA|nr:hypothetical protein PVAND_015553 [Polypedilum vanderplanki]
MSIPCEFIYDQNTYKCIITDFDLSTIEKIKNFNGEHFQGLSNNEVNMIVFRSSQMSKFPRGLTNFFPQLKMIEIFSCGLTEITKNDLYGLGNVVYLSIIFNNLKYLPGDLFEFTPNLQIIDFSGNQISTVGFAIFDPLKKIIEFTMRENLSVDVGYVDEFHPKQSARKLKQFKNYIKEKCRAMESLKDIVTMKLADGINETNVVDIFVCSSQFQLKGLKEKAFKMIKKKIVPWIDEDMINKPEKVLKMIENRKIR